jgi:hypothetical protein
MFLSISDVKILLVFGGGTIGGTEIKYVHNASLTHEYIHSYTSLLKFYAAFACLQM